MKINFKSAVMGLVVGCVITGGVSAFAYTGTENIQATFKNIKIFVDGSEFTPRDSAGNVLEPFIYNGSTYLPIRAVAEAVGKDVSYDANTNSVYLGGGYSNINGVTTAGTELEPYQAENATLENVKMGGNTYKSLLLSGVYPSYALYNINSSYSSVSGVYGPRDGSSNNFNGEVCFYGDGVLLKTLPVKSGELPKSFSVNISGASQLKIVFTDNGEPGRVGLGDMKFK